MEGAHARGAEAPACGDDARGAEAPEMGSTHEVQSPGMRGQRMRGRSPGMRGRRMRDQCPSKGGDVRGAKAPRVEGHPVLYGWLADPVESAGQGLPRTCYAVVRSPWP